MIGRAVLAMSLGGALLALPAAASAQATPPVRSLVPSKKDKGNDEVPESHMPPAGMCRIWIDNVPPAQQPAPTDCPTAIRNRPSNGRVIFGDDAPRARTERADDDKRERKRRKPGS